MWGLRNKIFVALLLVCFVIFSSMSKDVGAYAYNYRPSNYPGYYDVGGALLKSIEYDGHKFIVIFNPGNGNKNIIAHPDCSKCKKKVEVK
jgi:alpha-glucosidase (family GH31 glycosyl hydrolase)